MRILDTTTNWNRTFKNEDEIDDEQSARELFLFRPPAVRTWNCSDSRPVKDTFISASRARGRPGEGEGWGGEGGSLLEWIKLRHRTRVTVLKLSFNGRQCQKLSCLFRQFSCLFRLVVVSPSLELADAILLVVSISRGFALPIALVLRLGLFEEIWPHNGFYLRLLKILYV